VATCGDARHHGATVVAWGTYQRPAGRYRSYECRPRTGGQHRFSVRLDGGSPTRLPPGTPSCPRHENGRVTRWGRYGATGRERQRYRCEHQVCGSDCAPGCAGLHTFTGIIPRAHVCVGRTCRACRQARGVHTGDSAAARRSQVTAAIAATTLSMLSISHSYAKAGREALEALGIDVSVRRRAPNQRPLRPRRRWSHRKRRRRSAATRLAGRFWQVGASIVEAFGPIVWAAAEERLRERSAAIVALDRPRVWILDEIPVYALAANGKRRKSDGWVVLILAEMDWSDRAEPGATRLRLVRAMPKANSTAWRLVFAEVGHVPDIVVSDAATSIVAAVGRHFQGQDAPLFVPSLWHLGRALANNALRKAIKGPDAADLRDHLGRLGRDGTAVASVADWTTWWDRLAVLARASGLVKMDALRQTRANYETRMAAAIPVLAADPDIRRSTGGLESIIRDRIEPVLEGRRHQFANVERTNMLLDLVVARSVGLFSDLSALEDLITADALDHQGWTVPQRTIADPQPAFGAYRSLRDELLLLAVADDRGLGP
jgi:hypothetical protein